MSQIARYKKITRRTQIHISLPKYLMEHIEEISFHHGTSRSYEIEMCVLLSYLNRGKD